MSTAEERIATHRAAMAAARAVTTARTAYKEALRGGDGAAIFEAVERLRRARATHSLALAAQASANAASVGSVA